MENLTILIPTRNRPEDLKTCISSILESFGPDQKIVIGDNGNGESTSKVLEDFKNSRIKHLINPEGSSYVQNLDIIIKNCETEWSSIIHDDDYFNPGFHQILEAVTDDPGVDFVFSDHFVCNAQGLIDEQKTTEIYEQYRRKTLTPGIQSNGGLLAANQYIALDGFFVRTKLAQTTPIDLTIPVASDLKWLIEICDKSRKVIYLSERLFTYRISEISLTNTSNPLRSSLDVFNALRRTRPENKQTIQAIKKKKLIAILYIFKEILVVILPRPVKSALKSGLLPKRNKSAD